jgi:L-lactate permease
MINPVDVQQIAIAAIIAGAIVFFGAAYAVFYALAMLGHNKRFLRIAYAGYLALFACTVALAVILQLTGWWLTLVVSLLVGYFVAPRFIWQLSVAVHDIDESDETQDKSQSSEVQPQ